MLVRVGEVSTVADRICLQKFGEKHDCENDDQHMTGSSVLDVRVHAVVASDRDRLDWATAPGKLFMLVEWAPPRTG